jgi:hypothetical protein
MAVKAFCSYSHKDEDWKDRLNTYLAPLKNSDSIEFWHDRKMRTGCNWQSEIDRKINTADIIILLISPDFLASDYCYGREMKIALERHEKNETVVIPVILRPCDWINTPIHSLLVHPQDEKPINSYSDPDQAFQKIADEIRKHVEQMQTTRPNPKNEQMHSPNTQSEPIEIEFINRSDELKKITRTSSATYLLINAPAGYGKTRLLKKVIEHFEQRSFCIFLNLNGKTNLNLTQLANLIIKECNENYSDYEIDEQIGQVGLELIRAAHNAQKNDVLICIDDIESISSAYIKDLLNEFIPTIEQKLTKTPLTPINLRVIFSGRHPTKWLHTSSDIILKELKLTPFDYDSVHQTVQKFKSPHLPKVSQDYIQEYAMHLMWFTGGHPGAMAKILNNGDFGLDISSNEQKYYNNIIEPIIHQIRKKQIRKKQIPPDMWRIFETLSPVRKFNSKMLQHFIRCNLFTWETNPIELEDELLKTRLFGIADGFTINDSTRQLLSIQMRREYPSRFIKTCQEAIRFLLMELQYMEFRPDLYAIEILFLELQMLSTAKDRDPGKIISKFKEVVQYLERASAKKRNLASFRQYLLGDWEFGFMLNYLFRDLTTEKILEKIGQHKNYETGLREKKWKHEYHLSAETENSIQ